MDTKGKIIDFGLISRHLSGESSPQEEQQLNIWLDYGEENRKLFGEYKTLWEQMDKVGPIAALDLNAEWKSLESRMKESVPQLDIREEKRPSMVFLAGRIAVAAVVVMALTFGGFYFSRNVGYRTLATTGISEMIILPDGSTVTLNSYSSLEYPKKFDKYQRDIKLEGEGFFEVNGNPAWPFVISTAEVEIKVLGTSFNVNAYNSNKEIEVIVKTGQVAVTRHGEIPKTVILKSGNKAVYNKIEEDLSLSTRIDRNYLAWKTKSFIFEDQTLSDVTSALNKVYGSKIIIPSDSLQEARITSTFNDQSLEAILNVLSATLDLKVIENNGRILLTESN